MELNEHTSSIGKLALLFLALLLFAIWLAYDASAASLADLETDIVGYWNFDDGSGTTLEDVTDGTLNGTLYNTPAWTTGILGGALNFSAASSERVEVPDNAELDPSGTNWTASYWVQYTTVAGCALTRGWDGAASDPYRVGAVSDTNGEVFGTYNGAWAKIGYKTFSTGTWHHVVARWNGTVISVWKDGSQVDSTAFSSAIPASDRPLFIGVDKTVSTYRYYQDGALDEMGLWDRSLSDAEIALLYGSGTPPSYPFAVATTTDIDFTALDDFNGSSLNNFSINVSWGNGTTEVYNTNNGTVSLVNVSDSDLTINVTYFNATDYFNLTLLNQAITANTTNSIEASMFQAVATLSAREKITNNSLSDVTFYIGSKSGTVFNLTAGTHSVTAVKAGYYNYTGQINVPALSNASYSLEGLYNTIVNFTAYNAISNASVNSFTISIDFGENISTTNGTVYINAINNTNYTFNISSPGAFTSRFNLSFIANASTYNVNTSLYAFNSIRFNIFNESSLEALTQLVTVHTISNLTSFSNTTSTGFINIDLLQPNDYEIRFESAGFNPRSIFLTVINDSTQNITVYMTENTTTELQRIEVLDTANQPVEGAIVWLQKELINESEQWITIQEAQTDYNGETTVWVERDVTIFYRFAVIYEDEARPIQPSGNLFTGKTSFIPEVEETIQLIIDLEEDPVDFISDDLAISFDCNMTNTTATCTIIDGRNSITGAELRLEAAYINESLNWESIQNDSFTGSSGSLQVNLTAINNSVWRARAYVLYEDSENLIWEDEHRFDVDVIVEKNTGLLYAVIILAVVFGLTVMWGPLPSGIVGVCTLIPLTAIKIISIPIGVITGLLALVVIFFFRTRKNETE